MAKYKKFFTPKKISTNIGSFKADKKEYILDPKHKWNTITKNPKDFREVSKIMIKVLKKGKHSPYKSAYQATKKIKGQIVVVTYMRKGDKFLVSNAWVKR